MINCTASRDNLHGLVSAAPFINIQGGGFYGHAAGCGILVSAGRAAISGVQCSANKVGLKGGCDCISVSYVGNYLSDNETPTELSEASGVQPVANL